MYFGIDNNNRPTADFENIGLELKSTPMKELQNGKITPKERLVLNIIDYMKVEENGWKGAFLDKDSDLLIVFYLYRKDVSYQEFKIIKTTRWTFPEEDRKILRDDWNTIEGMILGGRADELSERFTTYLAACRKGAGHGGDMRDAPGPGGDVIKAAQRALSLKPSYMLKVFMESKDLNEVLGSPVTVDGFGIQDERTDSAPIELDAPLQSYSTYDEAVIARISRFKGMRCEDIENLTWAQNVASKSYYASISCAMFGVRKKHIQEFVDGDITMKIIRLKRNGRSKESMSFPFFRYDVLTESEWEDCDFHNQLDHRFFFMVFQMTDPNDSSPRDAVFLGGFFWSMPEQDMNEARRVWERTRQMVLDGKYEGFPKMTESRVAHVRPHAKNSYDLTPGIDGEMHKKYCFWLNADYISGIVPFPTNDGTI